MQQTQARIVALLAFGAALHIAQTAEARLPPDVLLLVDTSGSMAYTSVRVPTDTTRYALPTCAHWPATTPVSFTATTVGGSSSPPDRWTQLVKVLTGTVNGIACSAQSRSSTAFKQEFGLGGNSFGASAADPPPDADYYLPYNRIIATGTDPATNTTVACTPAPSWDPTIRQALLDKALSWPTNATPGTWPGSTGPIVWRTVGDFSTSKLCPFDPQEPDGIIDAYRELVRFGLMTFDSSPNWMHGSTVTIGTGLNGALADYPSGIGDTWSYFPGWQNGSVSGAATGWPGGCDTAGGLSSNVLEVGVRNPAAPPWEGRLLSFGQIVASADVIATNNSHVQAAITAGRPFGGTPVAGMLEDARSFLLDDTTVLPSSTDPAPYYWGGAVDPAVSKDPNSNPCRRRYLILLTDGGPNLDLRPECKLAINNTSGTAVTGKCPYELPAYTADLLKQANVPVYVIGFAVSNSGSGSKLTCSDLLDPAKSTYRSCTALTSCTNSTCPTSNKCAYGYCIANPDDELLATCCSIKGIADAGGGKAFFAEDASALFASFATILKDIVQPPISPSQPVFSSASAQYTGSSSDAFQGAQFLSASHQASDGTKTILGDLGIGDLDRQRIKCEFTPPNGPLEAKDKDVELAKGDKFQANIDVHKADRQVYTVMGGVKTTGGTSHIWSDRSIRPFYSETTGDGLGQYGISLGDSATKLVHASAGDLPTSADIDPRALVDVSNPDCQKGKCCFALSSSQADCSKYYLHLEMALDTSGVLPSQVTFRRSSAFGAVERTPVVVGAPSAYMRDDSYTAYQRLFTGTNGRASVLYATTADGQLHAFDVSKTDTDLNELWTFIPPAMLPALTKQFQNRQTASALHLMDGVLVTREVAGALTVPSNGRFLTRTAAQSKGGADATRWYTVLLGSYGTTAGFFALDVSWPDPTKNPPMSGYTKGPRFLWQLTTDANGNPLFGDRGSRPSIATLFFKMPGDSAPAEHAVAILPGGWGGAAAPDTFVPAQFKTSPSYTSVLDSRFTTRDTTREYTPDPAENSLKLPGARSLTIVRLDTGEIIRTFRYGSPAVPAKPEDKQAPVGLYTTDPLRVVNAGFDAPIVGEVVTYPALPGTPADRAYFGDAEGRLWRLNLTSTDPGSWDASMILDAYPIGGTYSTAKYLETEAAPIETPPVVSTDPLGRVTVAVSTGSQSVMAASGKYPVWSLTEQLSGSTPVTHVNWFLNENNSIQKEGAAALHFGGGERVLGPMSLFSGVLYFTSQRPPATSLVECSNGEAFIWAVHYINAGTTPGLPKATDGPDKGPMPEHPATFQTNPNVVPNPLDPLLVRYLSLGADSIAYGVGIRQRPSCYQTAAPAEDPFLGFGQHSAISKTTPGNFQLVIQSGNAGTAATGSQVKTITETIAPPSGGVTIDAWAAILE